MASKPKPTMTERTNGYVRWGPIITLLISLAIAVLGASAFLDAQHSSTAYHDGAVGKDMFEEFTKRIDQTLLEIRTDVKEIRRELRR